jgi:hypothetical protein
VVAQEHAKVPEVSSDEVLHALGRILSSKYFVHAPKKQRFLHLICDFYLKGRAPELNEYLIGRDVFDRDKDYQPSTDPIVRVGAHDIRKKLELYYHSEGIDDDIQLEIPIGCYEPVFVRRRPVRHSTPAARVVRAVQADSMPTAAERGDASVITALPRVTAVWKRTATWAMGVAAALLITVFAVLYMNLNLRQQVLAASTGTIPPAAYGHVWQQFLKSDQPTLLVLSNPRVFRFLNAGDGDAVVQRSVELTPKQATTLMEGLRNYFPTSRNPANARLVAASLDTYTGLGEAVGVHYVTDLLVTARANVQVRRSRTISAEDLRHHNVILFGSVWANEWSGKFQVQEDFIFTDQATIENRNPLAGEETVYRSRFDEHTGLLSEDYALVTVKPNISEGNVIMVLAGLRSAGTEAAAEYVTSKSQLNDLNQRLKQAGGQSGPPKYYQALLKVGVENGIPTTVSLVNVHVLRGVGP